MAGKIRIEDIARISGVSAGTIDRVIHGRGNVSSKSKKAVEEAISKLGYKPNLHISSIAIKKKYRIAITTPEFASGEYWDLIHSGFKLALEAYVDLDIECQYYFYNQFDLSSCRRVFDQVLSDSPDGVVIGPTFKDETMVLTSGLDDAGIPYVYVDSYVENTSPIATFCTNQRSCGYLIAKLLRIINPENSEFVLCSAERIGNESANNTILRKVGFREYFHDMGYSRRIHNIYYSTSDMQKNYETTLNFFETHPAVKGAVVLSSRGSIIAECLKKNDINDVKLVCLDLTRDNIEALREGLIDMVICQRPCMQGYSAIKALMMYFIFGKANQEPTYMSMDIITKESLDYYNESLLG